MDRGAGALVQRLCRPDPLVGQGEGEALCASPTPPTLEEQGGKRVTVIFVQVIDAAGVLGESLVTLKVTATLN